ncbi:MAG: hypothetical protein LBK82_05695 [Planctomycetaceae bacterium]|nr:hypothetical protein [Planctomycetaceae bacterium]
MLPFQGGVLWNLTRRVAAGWLVLPLKGRRNFIELWGNQIDVESGNCYNASN